MTTNWQRPRDEHGRFAKPADIYGDDVHAFVLGPQMGLCRECGRKWAEWPHKAVTVQTTGAGITRLDGWRIEPDPPRFRARLLAALPFVIALLGLGFSIAALIVGVQR